MSPSAVGSVAAKASCKRMFGSRHEFRSCPIPKGLKEVIKCARYAIPVVNLSSSGICAAVGQLIVVFRKIYFEARHLDSHCLAFVLLWV